ncbi:hypothetical protein T12_615 [Trichinella patagoniensis]|uniref:Uncharacterized protein n=1 Tax=Trichinella patagoniensis TaxID=990121 RepID=A0A0V1AB52_9BILA|nr:hypothetical protein T12_615 [Trichinella patagoniensis]
MARLKKKQFPRKMIRVDEGNFSRQTGILGVEQKATSCEFVFGAQLTTVALASVAKPDAHHFFVEVQLASQVGRAPSAGSFLIRVGGLEQTSGLTGDDRPFATSALNWKSRRIFAEQSDVERPLLAGLFGVAEPFFQRRFQFAHIFEAQIQRFESTDRRLRKCRTVHATQRHAYVALGEAECDAFLFEIFRESFQLFKCVRLLVVAVTVAGRTFRRR